MPRHLAALLACATLAWPVPAVAWPEERCPDGCYRLGLVLPASWSGGGLDGRSALASSEVSVGLPELRRGPGVGLSAAVGSDGSWVELRCERTWHRTSLAGTESRGAMQVWSLGWKAIWPVDGPVRPVLLLGLIPYAELRLDDDAVLASGATGPARLRAVLGAWQAGGGVEVRVGKALFVELRATRRWIPLREVSWPGQAWVGTGERIAAGGWHGALALEWEL